MIRHTFSHRADRPWPIVVLAVVCWLMPWLPVVFGNSTSNSQIVVFWLILVTLTSLPLSIFDDAVFRYACLTIGAIQVAIEALLSVAFYGIALPVFVAFFPAGALLLLAGWRRAAPVRTVLAAFLAVFPVIGSLVALGLSQG
ncbi:hypothetical protein [Streptomyces sp. FH025]|uniref:hypothetical protein n=1 Tax=Streptomyces sp. FH025 TaxID=2815937 RepID=UPI001A9F0843|nr:hypothetical protein [Streptomyces sp. FH025]MBO1418472.1 hypothetical protein [Streptomyces sp. FH025]